MTSVVLSIGSNLGDRLAYLQSVLDGLGAAAIAASPVYQTAAWGGVEQDDFLNAVVLADDPTRDPHDWLRVAHELENAADRVREQRWGPRTLDVDLVTAREGDPAADLTIEDDVLTLPHPHAHERAFVLAPWAAVEPSATLAVGGRPCSVETLLAALDPAERDGVRRTEHRLQVRR